MLKLMSVSNPADTRARVEVWLETPSVRGAPRVLHAVSFLEQREHQRRSLRWTEEGETLAAGARRICQELCGGLGWTQAVLAA
jgi:hypothetical protein